VASSYSGSSIPRSRLFVPDNGGDTVLPHIWTVSPVIQGRIWKPESSTASLWKIGISLCDFFLVRRWNWL